MHRRCGQGIEEGHMGEKESIARQEIKKVTYEVPVIGLMFAAKFARLT